MKIKPFEIKLEEGSDINMVQLLRAGSYNYYDDTKLEITTDMLRNMKVNFDNKVKKIDLMIDYSHMSHLEAAGWIKNVELRNGDTELWCEVEWTDGAAEKIKAKEYRYLSVDFDTDYVDNETSQRHGATLNGGGLTNRPFVKGMNPILHDVDAAILAFIDKNPENVDHIRKILTEHSKEEQQAMNYEDLKKFLVSTTLSEAQKDEIAKLAGIDSEAVKLSETVISKEAEIKALKDKNSELENKIQLQEKENEFAVLLSENKAVPAQKEAFLKGDMSEFVKLSVPLNTDPAGTGGKPKQKEDEPTTLSEAEEKISELAAEMMKDNKNLTLSEAIRTVRRENPKLAELIG